MFPICAAGSSKAPSSSPPADKMADKRTSNKPPCTVDGCQKNARNRGWCSMHYERWRKFGSTEERLPTLEERFWSKVDTSGGPDACWPWTAAIDKATGYGVFAITSDQVYRAHRVMYQLVTGEALGDKQIDHICFNRKCVNPKHLRPVTKKQNMENRPGAQRNSTTGVRGVSPTPSGKWFAQVTHNGRNHYLGTFDTIKAAEDAARLKRCELFTHNHLDQQTLVNH
jgi:HNH endonuclease